MRHLLSFSVYQDLSELGTDVGSALASVGCDGLEILTSYDPAPAVYAEFAETVHLPYASDWLAAWEDRPYDFSPEDSIFVMYGRSRDEVVSNLVRAVECAAPLSPAHGVLHAGNADLFDIMHHSYTRDSRQVMSAFADMVNQAVGEMPGGEPPFRIVFENLWWPGFRLTDESDYRYLLDRVEFENWGICVDTGHMMNCLPDIRSERDGIDALRDIFLGYSRELIDRISAVHFHWSASADYRASFPEKDLTGDINGFYNGAYCHVGSIDQHNHFTDPACAELLEILSPDYVVHEMMGHGMGPLEEFRLQRALLP